MTTDATQPTGAKKLAAELLSSASAKHSADAIRANFLAFAAQYRLLSISRSYHHIWYRACLCDDPEGFPNVRRLIYRPGGSESFGRASLPKSEVLYAGWNPRVALEEIQAKKGNYAQLIHLRVRDAIQFKCAVIGEYLAIFNSGRSVINSKQLEQAISDLVRSNLDYVYSQVFVDAVIAEIFRRKVERPSEYITSGVIADAIMSKGVGLMYPSVQTSHAINLAVRGCEFDKNFEVLASEVYEIVDYHGYGLYDLKPIKSTCEIAADGSFVWGSHKSLFSAEGHARGTVVPKHYVGWRADA